MRKTMIFSLFLLLFSACKKECERENTAILHVRNFTDSNITLFIEETQKELAAGDEGNFEFDLTRDDGSEIYQTAVTYQIDGKNKSQAFILEKCKTTTITISD